MIDGYTVEQFRNLPVAKRAGLFAEEFLLYGQSHTKTLEDRARVDIIIEATVGLFTGRYSEPEHVAVAESAISQQRQALLDNPDREVGRVACEFAWMGALYFGPELKSGVDFKV